MEEFQYWARIISDVLGDEKYRGYASDWARRLVEFALKCDGHNLDLLTGSFPIPCMLIWMWRRDEKKLEMVANGNVHSIAQDIFNTVAQAAVKREVQITQASKSLTNLLERPA